MSRQRVPISQTTRFLIFQRDDFTCQYCGATAPDAQLVVDHVVPVAKGGGTDPDNLVTACVRCNQGKSDKTAYPPSWLPTPPMVKFREIAISYTQDIQVYVWDTFGREYAPATHTLVTLLYRFRGTDVETAINAVANEYSRRGAIPNPNGYRYVAALIRHINQLRAIRTARYNERMGADPE